MLANTYIRGTNGANQHESPPCRLHRNLLSLATTPRQELLVYKAPSDHRWINLSWYSFPIGRRAITPEQARRSARLAERLKARREEILLTQEELADRAGIRIDTLRAIEQGKSKNPGVFFISDLALVLGVPVEHLTQR